MICEGLTNPGRLRSAATWLRRFAREDRGGFAVWFAGMVPAIAALAVGAVELQTLSADRAVMQGVADTAALSGAKELVTGQAGVTDRTKALADTQLALLAARYKTMDVTATLGGDGKSVVVMIAANRLSFFGNMLPPGGFKTLVKSTATGMSQQQVCVLTLDAIAGTILVADTSKVAASGCLVHSARDLTVTTYAGLTALAAQAVGVAAGPITPSGLSGAAPISDPFAGRSFPAKPCTASTFLAVWDPALKLYKPIGITGVQTFPPGVYCGMFQLVDGADVTLKPGDYYFVGVPGDAARQGKLSMKGNAKLNGNGVTLIFDESSKFVVFDTSKLALKAPASGANAGMLLIAPADNRKQFVLSSSSIDVLEGVIYTPAAELVVEGDSVGDLSKWTISITKALTVKNGASLVIKSDYAQSTVPVPAGIKSGSGPADVRLVDAIPAPAG